MTRIIESLAEISDGYDVLLCDLWGCLHDGRRPFRPAVEALRDAKARGITVVLVTNAPRSRSEVERQLDRMGLPKDCWDVITSSGDSARAAMFRGEAGSRVWFIGAEHDLSVFEPLRIVDNPVEIVRTEPEHAEGIVCCGPEDPYADPETYRPRFVASVERGVPLLCFNPDIMVDIGTRRQWCAGALARLYAGMGGTSHYFGKPHPPIYDLARQRLAVLDKDFTASRTLAIGDGIATDIAGAVGEGIDALFVTGGLAARETGTVEQPDPVALGDYLERENYDPAYSIGFLR